MEKLIKRTINKEYKEAFKTFLKGCFVGTVIMFFTVWIHQIIKHTIKKTENKNSIPFQPKVNKDTIKLIVIICMYFLRHQQRCLNFLIYAFS